MGDNLGKVKMYKLMGPDKQIFESLTPGQFGGNRKKKIYGKLNCGSALSALKNGYAEVRVFFADEAAAIAAGYRPCGNCMKERYRQWKAGVLEGQDYPWLIKPDE